MDEINLNKVEEYCTGCGRKSSKIITEIEKVGFVNNRRTWEGHTQYKGNDHYSDCDEVEFCAECGHPLDDEDFTSTLESRGEFWGAPCSERVTTGYTCGFCGHNETF